MKNDKKASGSVERGTCVRLLQHLADDGSREVRRFEGVRASAREILAAEYRPLEDRELEAILSKELIDTGERGAIFCRPVLKGTPVLLPLLCARIDLSGERPDAKFRVALFDIDDNVENVVGWRFETPSKGGDGMHNYHHAQPITGLIRGRPFSNAQWFNETTPAFLLDAHSPAALMIAMIVSLYGIGRINELLGLGFRNEIRSVAADMRSIQTYWNNSSPSTS
ncbi:hypothetical protein [Paractinoplanes brasiliensis]|uniref:hypothetical protein n=1 Tax=Paractinoplanes brasiliensis TaxID=52695 RepID=UPI00105F5EC1|nr:hypothetical protein [Actinoplanes brasiliensis]GID32674.1 hypothetical protein Abr02nite_76570 [Actinoplanes brasiliensis]